MSRFVLTLAARADVAEISEYISKDGPDAARRVRQELRGAMRKLAEMPELGHFRRDLTDEPLRFWPVFSCLVIYRPKTLPLQIIRVLHGSRDVRRILEELS